MNEETLLIKLDEQIKLIEFNLNAVKDLEIIALNTATNIRVLIHDTIKSISLLKHLDIKDKIRYYDTSTPLGSISYWKGNFSIVGWDLSKLPHIGIVGKSINLISKTECEIRYTPIYQDWNVKRKTVNFDEWWNTEIFNNLQGIKLTRKELILNAVNKAGGAHIDNPDEKYLNFSKKDALPFSLNNVPKVAENIPVYSCISQIGWELVESIKDYFININNS